jgi:Fungal Zn(2)-Cys(6) binuclear cluster domain
MEDTGRSQIRHASYCRKKVRSPLKPRKKSCLACIKAKTRCDALLPSCSRCLERKFTCLFQIQSQAPKPSANCTELLCMRHRNPSSGIEHSLGENPDASLLPSQIPPTIYASRGPFEPNTTESPSRTNSKSPNWLGSLFEGTGSLQAELAIYDEQFMDVDQDLLQTPILYDQFPLPEISPQHFPVRGHVFPLFTDLGEASSEAWLPAPHRVSMDHRSLDVLNGPVAEPALRAPKSFFPKRVRNSRLRLNSTYVVSTLRAYPSLILPGSSLPPFIHQHCIINTAGQDGGVVYPSLPGPLSACSTIMTMWSVKNKSNSPVIWRAIRVEQERLSEEVRSTQAIS